MTWPLLLMVVAGLVLMFVGAALLVDWFLRCERCGRRMSEHAAIGTDWDGTPRYRCPQ